jgi:hypothetical protein
MESAKIGNGNPLISNSIQTLTENQLVMALDTNGDGTGDISQNVDGSSTPVKFFRQPPSDKKYKLKRMNVQAIDGNFNNAAQYGALGAALTNGIRIYVENDGGIIKEYTSDFKIKRNHDWSFLAGIDSPVVGGAGEDALLVRWTFERSFSNITLDGSKNERLVVEIQDNLTGLTDQTCVVQGSEISI